MDAFEKRQDMNVEYLKNVLVKFLMSENKQVGMSNVRRTAACANDLLSAIFAFWKIDDGTNSC